MTTHALPVTSGRTSHAWIWDARGEISVNRASLMKGEGGLRRGVVVLVLPYKKGREYSLYLYMFSNWNENPDSIKQLGCAGRDLGQQEQPQEGGVGDRGVGNPP